MNEPSPPAEGTPSHFIHDIVAEDRQTGAFGGRVVTRFPPEPNGYLHIGHAKAICLDFGTAAKFGGRCHLRFDDTNPAAEEEEYVRSIQEDVRWLGFDWGKHLYFASDYFERMAACAVELIRLGKAYVCHLTPEEFKACRGVPERPGRESPWRQRTVTENLDLFARMRAGEFPDGSCVLRARIDMASPNLHLRDPALYRIKHAAHHRTGRDWCIYPMYDFAHCLEDSFEGITHSLCTLEFEVHRPLYDWILDQLGLHHPRQIEFARLNLAGTVMSKRRMLELVAGGHVAGWDDPRLPTLRGMRRRGYPPAALRAFCEAVGITKYESLTEPALLEHHVRDHLNRQAPRRMAVLDPVRLILDNVPEGKEEFVEAVNNPEDPSAGTRPVPFGRELWIERADFMEDPPKKFFRLHPGGEVRLRYACLVTCTHAVRNEAGEVTEIHAHWDPQSRGGAAADGRRVRGTLHWVSAAHAVPCPVRLYEPLFSVDDPLGAGGDFKQYLNPGSLREATVLAEPALAGARGGDVYQFERLGYFCADAVDSAPGKPVFNRTATLRDRWRPK